MRWPVAAHGLELVAVEEVGGGAALAEEEPVAAGCAEGAALMQEGAEGGDAGAGADHDDGRVGLFGQAEFLVRLNVDGQALAGSGAVGEEGGADAAAFAVVRAIADDGDGGVDLAGVGVRAGGDGVEARRELGQHGDEVGGIVDDAGIVVQQVDEAAVIGVLFEVRLLLRDEQAGELVLQLPMVA